MSIRDNNDWQTVELKARLAEAGQIYNEPVPDPDIKSQLAMCTTHNGQLQARIKAIKKQVAVAHMYAEMGELHRAQQEIERAMFL